MSDENDREGEEEDDDDDEDYDDEEDCSSPWAFCEKVWLIEEEDMQAGKQTGRCRARKLLAEEYSGFMWLKYEMVPLNYSGLMFEASWDEEDIPQLDCVHDNVECTLNIPFDDFCRIFH